MTATINGPDFGALSAQLKKAGRKDLTKQLSSEVTKAMKPVRKDILDATSRLPKRGGLAARVKKSKLTTRKNANGIRLVMASPDEIEKIDGGQVRHPVFKTGAWATQAVEPGFFTEPTEAAAPEVRESIAKAMQNVADQIGDGV